MPYIKREDRKRFDENLFNLFPTTPGELNFVITQIILGYAELQTSYQKINDVIGVLECAKLEFYRRFAAPYEDEKIKQNGDVYK